MSDATAAIQQMEEHLGVPSTIHGFFSGTLEAYQQSLSSEPILILTALLAVTSSWESCTRAWFIR